MKDYYTYKDGKIKVTEYKKGEKTIIDYKYQDNIEEILKTENIIEFLEKNKMILTNDINMFQNKIINNKKYRKKTILLLILSLTIISPLLLIEPIFFIFPASLFMSIFGVNILSYNRLIDYKNKVIKGNELELKKTNKIIKEKKEYLKELYKDQKITVQNIINLKNKNKDISFKEELIEIRDYLRMHFFIGCNKEEYKNYYLNNNIDNKLDKQFNEKERNLIKKYFEDLNT